MAFGDNSLFGPTESFQSGLNDQAWSTARQGQIANNQLGSQQANFQSGLLSGNQNSLATLQKLLGLFSGNFSSSSSSGGNAGGYAGLQKQLLDNINGMGAGRTQQINQQFQDTTNSALARLSDRGIGGSTYAVNAQQGAERGRQQSLNYLNDQLLGAKNQAIEATGMAGLQSQQQQIMQILGPIFKNLLG